jgi:hypothetical protein
MNERDNAHAEASELEGPTPGAQKQLDAMRSRMHKALWAMIVVVVLIAIAFGATGLQIKRAFDNLETERISRIGGQSSINAYFCHKIDEVGNGVGGLVSITLPARTPAGLSPGEVKALDRFRAYVKKQDQPPRCRQIALQLAILTGADPSDVVIKPLHLRRR